MAAQNDPIWLQDRSWTVLDHFFCLWIFRFVFESFSAPSWTCFGRHNDPWEAYESQEIGAGGGFKTVLRSSWSASFFILQFLFAFLVLLGSSWSRFMVLQASFSELSGAPGVIFKAP